MFKKRSRSCPGNTAPQKEKNTNKEKKEIPIINMEGDRVQNILKDEPALFEIEDNPNVDGSEPLLEIGLFNPIGSGEIYEKIALKYGLDPGWLKAIAYMENTHGYYDAMPGINLVNDSYRPMNVQYKTWKGIADELGFSEWQVQYRVECNVEVGAVILSRIKARVVNPTLEKVASIYVFTGAELTRDYGARVQKIYEERLWEK
ncbi:hypothetical protein KDD30_20625 (plasmid) [Photobacterium sp. GJ3]|uniref:hypothetical protein n=1 Tax=Photobacterium sp. GJ3 TaxID=2829502 RepID=UPI001B8BF85E|nr:hypothetical protein [Photobacterium sp. GJ3]QUJ70498.1 hypothetical protein KDD30_20625 [Photobacterium sp. GJ3]